jgi:prepilin-type N-terminal cleavage/methylation domain-containing protein
MKSRGFSLIETLISLMILGVILSAAMPMMTTVRNRNTGFWKTALSSLADIYFCRDGLNCNVGIGTNNAMNARLVIKKSSSAQTTNMLEMQDENGNTLTSFDKNGVPSFSSAIGFPNGRLTLSATNPYTIGDNVDSNTLYYLPYAGENIALWNGTSWKTISFVSTSLTNAGLVANKNYDVFAYLNGSGDLALEFGSAWTDDRTRSASLFWDNGIIIKLGNKTRRYLGTVRTNPSNLFADGYTERFVYNRWNQVKKQAFANWGGQFYPPSVPYTSVNAFGGGTSIKFISGMNEYVEGEVQLRSIGYFGLIQYFESNGVFQLSCSGVYTAVDSAPSSTRQCGPWLGYAVVKLYYNTTVSPNSWTDSVHHAITASF